MRRSLNRSTFRARSALRLPLQQLPLTIDTPTVAAESTTFTHHPVTGNYDRYRVGRAGSSDRARSRRFADGPRDLAIGAADSRRNLLQRFPHAPLKRGSFHVQWHARILLWMTNAIEYGLNPLVCARGRALD